ncbi:MAG TPA: NYN domain-containing protein [Solirubrobacterales bacterium]|nr:NYN domain-containing protein [Solirubrobacterales bacterium]
MANRWLIDGMNLIGSRPTGWWRDRAGAMRELVDELERFVDATGDEVTVVFDGRPGDDRPAPGGRRRGRLWVAFAPGGRDAADDQIAERVGRLRDPRAVSVVTSDKGLVERMRDSGVGVVPVGRFRGLLDSA